MSLNFRCAQRFGNLVPMNTPVSENLQRVRQQIELAAVSAGRVAEAVKLLAVSKTMPAQAVREAYAAGQIAFGENYIQEGVDKMAELADLPLEWHCIGPIQSNKTKLVAENFAWVHSLDRLKIAERLSAQRPAHLPPLQVCLQVNVDGGANKSGVSPHDLLALAQAVAKLPQMKLRGLMTIPEPAENEAAARAVHHQAKELFDSLNAVGLNLDTLSMGMTADLGAAIAEGSTCVRVGTAIFGSRH
jgi:pyridoxal phosphate enzyme (YggS family)